MGKRHRLRYNFGSNKQKKYWYLVTGLTINSHNIWFKIAGLYKPHYTSQSYKISPLFRIVALQAFFAKITTCVFCNDSLDESHSQEEERAQACKLTQFSLDGFQGIPWDTDPKLVLAMQHFNRQRRLCLHTEKEGRQRGRGRKKLPTYSIKGTNNGGMLKQRKGRGRMWFFQMSVTYSRLQEHIFGKFSLKDQACDSTLLIIRQELDKFALDMLC